MFLFMRQLYLEALLWLSSYWTHTVHCQRLSTASGTPELTSFDGSPYCLLHPAVRGRLESGMPLVPLLPEALWICICCFPTYSLLYMQKK